MLNIKRRQKKNISIRGLYYVGPMILPKGRCCGDLCRFSRLKATFCVFFLVLGYLGVRRGEIRENIGINSIRWIFDMTNVDLPSPFMVQSAQQSHRIFKRLIHAFHFTKHPLPVSLKAAYKFYIHVVCCLIPVAWKTVEHIRI